LFIGCGNQLSQFIDEQRMPVTIVSNQYSSIGPALLGNTSTQTSLVWFADKAGSFYIRTQGNCDAGTNSTGTNATGSMNAGARITSAILWSDLPRGGGTIYICAVDSFNLAKGSATQALSTPTDTALTTLVQAQNDSVGGSGTAINSGVTAAFTVFQDTFAGVTAHRGLGSVNQAGISSGYSQGAYIDPNDDYKLKYFANDRGNHRVLIFNSIPTSSSAVPDVVVGQPNFTSNGSQYSTGSVNGQGFNSQTHVTVCANGIMYVSDAGNNRVAAFSPIPRTNGATASFVIGQPSLATNSANAYGATGQSLSAPYAAHCVGGKLFILDRNNARVPVFNTAPTTGAPGATAATANYVIGRPDLTTLVAPSPDYATQSSYLNTSGLYEIGAFNNAYYIVDGANHRVLVFNSVPTVSNVKPDFVIGQTASNNVGINQGAGDNNCNATTLHFPNSLAFKGSKLAIADTDNARITFYDLPISANGPTATHQLGQSSFTGFAAGTGQGQFGIAIKGLIFDGSSFIWVMDGPNHRVQVLQLPF